MECNFLNNISDDWVQEKLNCTNAIGRERTKIIEERIRSKFETGPRYFTAVEFKDFLIWKGLARNVPDFLSRYENNKTVEEATCILFENNINQLNFENINDETLKEHILTKVDNLFSELQQRRIKYVGPGVASACIALCYPKFCGTVDYIVPGLLHNEYDHLHNMNPLFIEPETRLKLQEILIMPLYRSLSASEARNLAIRNYRAYIEELWNIKRRFGLNHSVREIEEAIWSFGICYIKKNTERLPLTFNTDPKPPRAGPFSKCCPN